MLLKYRHKRVFPWRHAGKVVRTGDCRFGVELPGVNNVKYTIAAAVLTVTMLAACSAHQPISNAQRAGPSSVSQLPFGGRTILPGHRVVAFYGAAQIPNMGVLGQGPPDGIARRLLRQARAYAPYGAKVVPAFELIATVAQRAPGVDGDYSAPTDAATIARFLKSVRAIHGILILDVQPGRSPFMREVRRYEKFLKEPDVSLALDSEWSMGSNEVPAQVIGGTTGEVVNKVSAYLETLVRRYDLPQKLLIVHEFTPDMIAHRDAVIVRPGLAIVYHVDGFGSRAAKLSKYGLLARNRHGAFMGFKLFYTQDIDMLAPSDVMRLRPAPDLVTYQ